MAALGSQLWTQEHVWAEVGGWWPRVMWRVEEGGWSTCASAPQHPGGLAASFKFPMIQGQGVSQCQAQKISQASPTILRMSRSPTRCKVQDPGCSRNPHQSQGQVKVLWPSCRGETEAWGGGVTWRGQESRPGSLRCAGPRLGDHGISRGVCGPRWISTVSPLGGGVKGSQPRLCQVPAAKSLPVPRGPEGREGLRRPWQGWAAGREAARRRGQISGPHPAGPSAGQSRTGHVASSSGPRGAYWDLNKWLAQPQQVVPLSQPWNEKTLAPWKKSYDQPT